MTHEQEIRAKSMELALSFIELAFEKPITLELAMKEGYGEQELDRAFNTALAFAKRFEDFILNDPGGSKML
jgi:hypothetical protein